MKVTHNTAAGTFTLTGKMWSNTYPLDQLDAWLAFYRRQRDEHPKSGNSYDKGIAGLGRCRHSSRPRPADQLALRAEGQAGACVRVLGRWAEAVSRGKG
ncbi:hypothetical protein [Frigidibacter sp. MR17.24]|uniref:hypothetical protein n=1 Tax=Frigidibacter sp. MR17.24 TaxID=3127345 RepID=UPI0030131B75